MKIEKRLTTGPLERIYIAACELAQFRGGKNVEVQLFRTGATPAELAALGDKDWVGAPPADMPAELLQGATREAALQCLLEAFTEKEIEELCEYLQKRYGNQITRLTICPMNLPVPLGVGPLGQIPETESSGFIKFDEAPGYNLNFGFRGYFDLNQG